MSSMVHPDHKDENEEVSKITKSLKHSPSLKGFHHLASDGVYRSFSSSGEVVDYKQLSPVEIETMMKFFKRFTDPESFKKAEEKFAGVDGRDITDLAQLLHPGPELCPPRSNNEVHARINVTPV